MIFGQRGTGAHAAEEWVEVESLARCADVYADAVRLLVSAAERGGVARGTESGVRLS